MGTTVVSSIKPTAQTLTVPVLIRYDYPQYYYNPGSPVVTSSVATLTIPSTVSQLKFYPDTTKSGYAYSDSFTVTATISPDQSQSKLSSYQVSMQVAFYASVGTSTSNLQTYNSLSNFQLISTGWSTPTLTTVPVGNTSGCTTCFTSQLNVRLMIGTASDLSASAPVNNAYINATWFNTRTFQSDATGSTVLPTQFPNYNTGLSAAPQSFPSGGSAYPHVVLP